MKNNKKIAYIIGAVLVVIGLSITVFSFMSNNNSLSRLKGDVSGAQDKLSITCTKTSIDVNETTSCSISVNSDSYRLISFQGLVSSSSNITISNIQMGAGWESQAPEAPELIYYRDGSFDPGNVGIVSFDITGTTAGSGHVKIGKQSEELFMAYDDDNLGTLIDLVEKTLNITVGDSTDPVISSDSSLKHIYINNVDVIESLTYTVDSNISSITVTPEKNNPNATVNGGGVVSLSEGNNNVSIEVIAEDQTSTTTYVVAIYRTPSVDKEEDYLSSLSITPGSLNETFSPDTYAYTATVGVEVESVVVNATATKETSTVTGTGEVNLNIGTNFIEIEVTSEDGVVNDYTLVITRSESSGGGDVDPSQKSNDASVKSITVDGVEVSLDTLTTTVEYLNNDFVEVIVTPNSSVALVKGDVGSRQLIVGENLLNILVEAEDGTKNSFVLKIIRKSDSSEPSGDSQCVLSSDTYKVDNVNLKITNVNLNDNADTIKKNLKASCGTIDVSNEKVILTNGTSVKKYIIDRVWYPKTGNDVVKYGIIIGSVILSIGITLLIKDFVIKKEKKKE